MSAFTDYFGHCQGGANELAPIGEVHSCSELMERVQQVGFLPLLESGIAGYSAEGLMAEECRFVEFADGTWEWPLWQWKGPVVTEGGCVYGKFFAGKAGFVAMEWWPDLLNWRRSRCPAPEPGSVEEAILAVLREHGSMITRELRAACGFTGAKMRSRFDAYVTRLQMACRIVTEDFVYPRDKHGREYGFGWALLTTPERLLGAEACRCEREPKESLRRMTEHMTRLLPGADEKKISKMLY